MLGINIQPVSDQLRSDAQALDRSTRQRFGVSAVMFRTAKFVFYIVTLLFSGYLIELASVDPFVAMSFAALLITGPEGLEAYLVRQGIISDNSELQNHEQSREN